MTRPAPAPAVSADAARADRTAAYDAFDSLATMVAVVTPVGHWVFANAAFEQVLGVSRRAVLGGSLFDRFADPGPLVQMVAAVARQAFDSGRLEAQLHRPPGPQHGWLPVLAIVSPAGSNPPGGDVIVELVEIEQQARQDREQRALEQAQAGKELVRNLAHEIRNPLGGIRGAAQLLEMELASPTLTEYTQVVIREADRLQTLVDRLLAPHRSPQRLAEVNIHEVCERVRALVLAEFATGLAVQRDYDVSIPDFRGDPEQLIQALLNIVRNAAQALAGRIAAGDGRILLRTRIARQLTIGQQRHRLALELQVEDNGPGVAQALRQRIFYPLVSGSDGGSGLGLTLAQTFVQQHHGSIECDSHPGSTLFTIALPLTPA